MFFNLIYILIDSLTKCVLEDSLQESCALKILQNLQKNIHNGIYC